MLSKEESEPKMSVQIEIVNPEDKRVKISFLKVGDWFVTGECSYLLFVAIKKFGDQSVTALDVENQIERAFKQGDLVYLADVKITATKKV